MQITARGDYALRAALELAKADGETRTVTELAAAQGLPVRFLENILLALRHASLLLSRRGSDGGFSLARSADLITIADVLGAAEGALVTIRGMTPEELTYTGPAEGLREVWIALQGNLRALLERITLAELAAGALPGQATGDRRDRKATTIAHPNYGYQPESEEASLSP